MQLGRHAAMGRNVSAGKAFSYPWDGNSNVIGWVPERSLRNGSSVVQLISTYGGHILPAQSPATQPTYNATLINGNPGLSFTSANELIATSGSFITQSDGDDTSATMILLAAITTSASGSQFCGWYNGGSARNRFLRAGAGYRIDRAGVSGQGSAVSLSSALALYTCRFVSTGTVQHFEINGVSDANYPSVQDRGTFVSNQFALFPQTFGGATTAANFGGLWLVTNDDTAAIAAIEAWALARAGL